MKRAWFGIIVLVWGLAPPAGAAAGASPVQPQSLGSEDRDFTYTPVAPCRILDTRGPTQIGNITGPLAPGTIYNLQAAAACGIPSTRAKAVMMNVVAVNPLGQGNLKLWPWDEFIGIPPTASVLNYGVSAGINIANGLVVSLCNRTNATAGDCSYELYMSANFGATDVVIDVLGYFAWPLQTQLDCQTLETVEVEGTHVTPLNAWSPVCPTGYTLTGGCIRPDPGEEIRVMVSTRTTAGNQWFCEYNPYDNNTVQHTSHCFARCCRLPGL